MARELNRDLFGQIPREGASLGGSEQGIPAYAKADEIRVLHLHIESLSKKLQEFESRVESMQRRVDEMTAQNKQRFERVQGHFQRQNEMIQTATNETNKKIAQVVSRVNERKVEDSVVKEMVERQSNLVQTFEVRMQQLTRVISEQEMQLMNSRSELRDALQELTRLKKL